MKILTEQLDLHSKQFTLNIFGKKKKETILGYIIGSVSIIAMTVISSFFINVLHQGSQMNLVTNYDQNIRPLNNMTNINIQMGKLSTGKTINMTGLVNIELKFYKLYLNGFSQGVQIIPYNLSQCNKDNVGDSYLEGVTEMALCTPIGTIMNMEGKYGDLYNGGWSQIQILLNRCDPSKEWCHNETYIDEELSSVALAVSFASNTINHLNKTNPNNEIFYTYPAIFSLGLVKIFKLNLQNVIYDTDQGFVFEDHQVYNFNIFEKDSINIDLKSSFGSLNLGHILLTNSNTVMKVNRSYMKAQSVLAQIGGIIKVILIIGQILQDFLLRKHNYIDIANFLFSSNTNNNQDISLIEMIEVSRNTKSKIKLSEVVVNRFPNKDNFKKSASIRLKLSICELICFNFCLRRNQNILNLEKAISQINNQLSVETIVKGNFKIDYLEKLVLNESQIKDIREHRPLNFESENIEIEKIEKNYQKDLFGKK